MVLMDYLKKATPTDADVLAKMENQQNNTAKNEDAESTMLKPETSAVVPNVSAAARPDWMSEEEWNAATQYYSPERISQLYKGFDPNSVEPFYQTLYKTTRRNPTIPDEKRIQAANNIASAADGLRLIVQGIAGAKGAYIPEDKTSAMRNNDAYVQRLRDIYKADRDKYDSGLYQSVLTDIEMARQGYNRDRSGLLGVIQNAARMKNQRDIANAKNALDLQKWQSDQDWRKVQAKATEEYREKQLGIARMNADANVQRAIKSSTGKDNQTEPYYDPNTGTTYHLKKNVFKTIYPRIFKELENDVFKGDPSEKQKYKALSPSERMNYVLAHWPESPSAVRLMKELSISVDEGEKKNENQVSKKIGW
ncbi:hypothetical protein [Parabacteroides sp. AM08-6]|uniref:hypothetical protein n=1 Tax=Parabacteroides sp. AM08-6 TaxID=2292053 RepID=UPI000EFDEACD|nr:hypothetical protein [Parabacteroides sp. AM08-6]RHJ77705.1 hypothetical protein DW103_16045 [Parabacteroides sp. AM08-6]